MKARVIIQIGQVYTSLKPVIIETTLGSCVSVCLFDPGYKAGGMNHILLAGRAGAGDFNLAARYGINAMEILINSLMKLGVRRHELVAKVFGGARMFNHMENGLSPGARNVEFVMNFLDLEKIPVIASDVGGENARRILFASNTGEVFLKRLPTLMLGSLRENEQKYCNIMNREMEKKTKITLFRQERSARIRF